MKIAIQGVRGAFHETAAQQFFGQQVEVVPALSFPELFNLAEQGAHCDGAIAAIENNLAGSILGNYKLLQNSRLQIVGEVFLPIDQHLMALPGADVHTLQEVHSHPMALAQCADFFKQFPHIRLIEADDTAASAQRIAASGSRHIGAIAGELAAELYNLSIIARKIQDNPLNYTRFLALLPPENRRFSSIIPNKTSVCFIVPHQPGALSKVLAQMAEDGANLTKIQSVPIEGTLWEYRFFLDYTFDDQSSNDLILNHMQRNVTHLQILGSYRESTLELP